VKLKNIFVTLLSASLVYGCGQWKNTGSKPPEAKVLTASRGEAKKKEPAEKKQEKPDLQNQRMSSIGGEMNDWISALNRELETRVTDPVSAAAQEGSVKDAKISPEATMTDSTVKRREAAAVAGKSLTRKEAEEEKEKEKEKVSHPKSDVDVESLRVKVLSGDGKMASAESMSDRLIGMGYKVSSIDKAPKAVFRRNTIFFAENCRDAATRLAGQLGGKAICRPLTWKSVYDLIVVTGK
jgi:hypothetical protein